MFKYLKLKAENARLKRELDQKLEIIGFLYKEIASRDQKIIEQQKRMRFFGIQIGNEDYEAEKLDFSFYYKNLKKGVYMQGRIAPEGNS